MKSSILILLVFILSIASYAQEYNIKIYGKVIDKVAILQK
jgi:hypothetical protein